MSTQLSTEELREVARGERETGVNEPCPFCGTSKLTTRIGPHIVEKHRQELYEAVADYREK